MSEPKILVYDLERVPMRTKNLEVWDPRSLQNRRLTADDIETWGRTICMGYQWYGERGTGFLAEWQEGGRDGFLAAAWELINEAHVVVGHNMQRFDQPHLQGEFELAGLRPASPVKIIDTLKIAQRNFNYEMNNLDVLTRRFGLTHKNDRYSSKVAWGAVGGNEKDQRRIERYCRGDVRATTALYTRLRPHSTVNLSVFFDDSDEVVRCPACTKTKVQKRGVAVTGVSRFQRYQCQSCGAWGRGKKALAPTTEMRPG
jgi:ribosomal protein S27E